MVQNRGTGGIRAAAVGIFSLMLAACGGVEKEAADVCEAAVLERLADRVAEVNSSDIRANVVKVDDNTFEVNSYVDFERTSPRAYRQTFTCRVTMKDPDGTENPRVIHLQFNW